MLTSGLNNKPSFNVISCTFYSESEAALTSLTGLQYANNPKAFY